jgi:HPt (histidine-containing phosphotransfer) domain-containing protein
MTRSKLLLLEYDAGRAERVAEALEKSGIDCVRTSKLAEAQEALSVQQFDIILVTCPAGDERTSEQLSGAVSKLSNRPMLVGYGQGRPDCFDAVLPSTVPEAELGPEILRLCRSSSAGRDETAARLSLFDLSAFRRQMGDDQELAKEIVGIFREESAEQLRRLHEAVADGEYHGASRIAHSLKGSLGNLHSDRARYWAQELESAAAAQDGQTAAQCLTGLERTLSALAPKLQNLLGEEA